MANNQKEGEAPNEEQLIGNLLVETVDDRFLKQRFNVEFAFLCDTTVDTVLDDLEEALASLGLRSAIQRDQCALLYDGGRTTFSDDIANTAAGRLQEHHKGGDTPVAEDGSTTVLSGADVIFRVPEVEAFYDLNRRCGLGRVATFRVVKRMQAPLPSRGTSHTPVVKATPAIEADEVAKDGLAVYRLHRKLQFDELPREEFSPTGDGDNNEVSSGYKHNLLRVRQMVAAAEKSILDARRHHYQQQPPREPHWSVHLNTPPSRHEWLGAIVAEAAAYDRLRAKLAKDTTQLVTQQETSRCTLEKEVAQLHQRIDGVKTNVVKRQVLQERAEELKIEIEAQREKEQDLLRSLERARTSKLRQATPPASGASPSFGLYAEQHRGLQLPPAEASASALGTPLAYQNGLFSSRRGTPPPHPAPPPTPLPASVSCEFAPNYSTIQSPTTEIGAVTGSQFLSPSLREDVRYALSSHMRSPVNAQQSQVDFQRLRHLAEELGNHLRSPNPDPAERQRLMGGIRNLRREIEQRRETESRALLNL
ncbi:hypothetical protein TraAM80_08513 [Trypanosoma rangeli]|uniref:Uncharacterized protein n=1 Tax=Trypanosoma rangeli TaxID=5698 RepID=A0A3R7KPM2_TRYRA|nr:uncharacterized protein TraAM80_08513 [Trypanosoma rangeli]RNE98894.1 hypothetical protein TraAM80_08513 [Trypanosoma rangeli]|eukprot:RNE98894.1 hypothetical protein TraAM80_08513 [Trypanosoma rangeli]